jgi:predicted nucleotidyltransferase
MIKYSPDLTNKQELRFLSDLIADVRAKVPKVDILLVGATARDLILLFAHGIKPARGTEDIDLAFAAASWSHFEKLRRSLLSSDLFRSHPSASHKLLYRKDVIVDLIPFGGLENADGTISWPPHGDTVMSVLGFEDALKSSIDALLPSGQQVSVVSLPMLAVLKVLAWLERRTSEPRKDASDLMLVLQNYLDAGNSERLYSEAAQLLENPDFDYERAGAWLAGKDALETIQQYSSEANRIEKNASLHPCGRNRSKRPVTPYRRAFGLRSGAIPSCIGCLPFGFQRQSAAFLRAR